MRATAFGCGLSPSGFLELLMEVTTELLIAEWRTLREAADQLRGQLSDARDQLRQRCGELVHYRCTRRLSFDPAEIEQAACFNDLFETV
jgi:hypothetical protein